MLSVKTSSIYVTAGKVELAMWIDCAPLAMLKLTAEHYKSSEKYDDRAWIPCIYVNGVVSTYKRGVSPTNTVMTLRIRSNRDFTRGDTVAIHIYQDNGRLLGTVKYELSMLFDVLLHYYMIDTIDLSKDLIEHNEFYKMVQREQTAIKADLTGIQKLITSVKRTINETVPARDAEPSAKQSRV